jgi:hypothetical protein
MICKNLGQHVGNKKLKRATRELIQRYIGKLCGLVLRGGYCTFETGKKRFKRWRGIGSPMIGSELGRLSNGRALCLREGHANFYPCPPPDNAIVE